MNNSDVQDVIDSIVDYHLPSSSIWIHEKILCRAIPNIEGCSAREVLTKSIKCLKQGFVGTQRKKTRIKQGGHDLEDNDNELSIILQTHGVREDFPTTSQSLSTTTNQPRWFFYGKSPTLSVGTQLQIARDACLHDEVAEKNWMKWYLRDAGVTRSYQSKVSKICEEYKIDEPTLRHILYYSNFVVGRTRRSIESTVLTEPATNNRNETIHCPTTRATRSIPPSPNTPYPEALKECNLSLSNDSNVLQNVASIELLVSLARKNKTSEEMPDLLQRANVSLPITVSIDEVMTLNSRSLAKTSSFIIAARKAYFSTGMFVPREDEMLHEWIQDGFNYSKGNRLTIDSHSLNDGNRKPELNTATTAVLRHVMFTLNIPLHSLNTLWVLFYVLITGRALPLEKFSDMNTIWNNIMRLHEYDTQRNSAAFAENIIKLSEYGFRQYFGGSSDDSEHYKAAMHVLIAADIINRLPSFRLLSCTPAQGKDAEGNARKNFQVFKDLFDDKVLGHYSGSTTDNAKSAMAETRVLFEKILEYLRSSNDPELIKLTQVNGVTRRPIAFGDMFHIDNCIVTSFSVKTFGDTENAFHTQIHHRQLLMTMHSLHSSDIMYSNMAMAEVMNQTGKTISLKTTRERAQRWLVNQKYSAWTLETMKTKTTDGVMCLSAWALYFHNHSKTDWKRRAGKEVAAWLESDLIQFGLIAEAEVGDAYFAHTYYWHNRPGALHTRPGFRMMEVHELYFGFMLPFWTTALTTPEKVFPRIFQFIKEKFTTPEEKLKRTKQIMIGIQAAYDKLVEMTEPILLRGPVSFLILCNNEHGPSFCRALISVVTESGSLPASWNDYAKETDDTEQTPDITRWYDILSQDSDDTVHWYRQLCLYYEVVLPDIYKLSQEKPSNSRSSGIINFKNEYPVLFDALYAVFRLLPSNSRLCEQIHGMLRHSFKCEIGMDQADAQYSYNVNTEYHFREVRRALINTKVDADGNRVAKVGKHDRTKAQTEMIGKQMIDSISEYSVADVSAVTRSIAEINTAGRRVQDKRIAVEKELLEKQKQAKMRRTMVTIDEIREVAKTIIPDNELNPYSEDDLKRRAVTTQLSTMANWNPKKVEVQFVGAWEAFPLRRWQLWDAFQPAIRSMIKKGAPPNLEIPEECITEKITTKAAMLSLFIRPYLNGTKKVSELILSFMFGVKKYRIMDEPKKTNVTDLIDVMSAIFINHKAGAEVDLSRKLNKAKRAKVITNLVQSVKTINTHYNTKRSNTNILDDNDIEQESYL